MTFKPNCHGHGNIPKFYFYHEKCDANMCFNIGNKITKTRNFGSFFIKWENMIFVKQTPQIILKIGLSQFSHKIYHNGVTIPKYFELLRYVAIFHALNEFNDLTESNSKLNYKCDILVSKLEKNHIT